MNMTALACRQMPGDCRIQQLAAMQRRPIMYYRPQAPDGSTFLKVPPLLHATLAIALV